MPSSSFAGSLALVAALGMGACGFEAPAVAPDAAPVAPADAAPVAPDATPACEDVEPAVPSHHAIGYEYGNGGVDGAGCLGQCHDGQNGPRFTIGGSLWDRRTAGGAPIAGGVIHVIDGGGRAIRMVSNQAGQFWYRGAVTQPLRTYATGCPDAIPMVANTSGNCSAGGACHGSDNKIYLPGASASP